MLPQEKLEAPPESKTILLRNGRNLRIPPKDEKFKKVDHGSLISKKHTTVASTARCQFPDVTSQDVSSKMQVNNNLENRSNPDLFASNSLTQHSPSMDVFGLAGNMIETNPDNIDPSLYALPVDNELDLELTEGNFQQSHSSENVKRSLLGENHRQRHHPSFQSHDHNPEWDPEDADLKEQVIQKATATIQVKYWGILKKNPNLCKNIPRQVELCYAEDRKCIVSGSWKDVDAVVSLITEAYKGYKLRSQLEEQNQERNSGIGTSPDAVSYVSKYDHNAFVMQSEEVKSNEPLPRQDSTEKKERSVKQVTCEKSGPPSENKTDAIEHVEQSLYKETTDHDVSMQACAGGDPKIANTSETLMTASEAHKKPSKMSKRLNRTFTKQAALYEKNELAKTAITSSNGIVVEVEKGDILTLKETDCVISCTDGRFSYQPTGLAGALCSVAGDAYKKAYAKIYHVPRHECISTEAGNLPYKNVLHVVLSSWKACLTPVDCKNCVTELKRVLASAFIQANKKQMLSIAVPAIGTGYLGYPIEEWVTAVLEVIVEYINHSNLSKQSLKKIRFVDQNVQWLTSLGEALRHKLTPESPLETTLSKTGSHTFCVTPGFAIKVFHGSITTFKGDAIAITDDLSFCGFGNLATSVSRAAGEQYRREKRAATFSQNPVLLTSAGILGCSKILHVGLSDYPDIFELDRCLRQILQTVSEMNMAKIAVPLIASGYLPVEDACKMISEVIWNHPVVNPNTSLREVWVMETEYSKIDLIVGKLTKLETTERMKPSIEMAEDAERASKNPRDIAVNDLVPLGCGICHDRSKRVVKTCQGCGHGICSKCLIPGIDACRVCRLGSSSGESDQGAIASNNGTEHDVKENCSICLGDFNRPFALPCGHVFCEACIKRWFSQGKKGCALCQKVCGILTGNQPPGTMDVWTDIHQYCVGFESFGLITINYTFPDGIQDNSHPNPGSKYSGIRRTAYLPDNHKGRKVLRLLKKAFDQRLIFTVGTSVTNGQSNTVTWNDIHHKTSRYAGPQRYGYPDPTYLTRVQEELKANGITDDQEEHGTAV